MLATATALQKLPALEVGKAVQRFLSSAPTPRTTAETIISGLMMREAARNLDVANLGHIFVTSRQKCAIAPSPSADQSVAHAARQFIDDHYTGRLTCASVADQFRRNPGRLNSLFMTTFGLSVRSYVERVRISEAVSLLTDTPLKVEAIALMVGYRSKTNFYRAFRNILHRLPCELRRSVGRLP